MTDGPTLLSAAQRIGFANLTVGAVTASAGVKYSTFYRHFPSLDALISALVDEVCEKELVVPTASECWKETVGDMCSAVAVLLDRYPGMARAVMTLPAWPAEVLALHRRLADVMTWGGIDPGRASVGAAYALETVAVTQMTSAHERVPTDRGRRFRTTGYAPGPGPVAAATDPAERPASELARRKIELLVRGLATEIDDASSPDGHAVVAGHRPPPR